MDIHSSLPYPSCELSNFAPHAFVVDGEPCASMEGFIQSLKFEDVDQQRATRALAGMKAKRAGAKRNKDWQEAGTLWWKGTPMARDSRELSGLFDQAFAALHAGSEVFRLALAATGAEPLTHEVGDDDPSVTALTKDEFCERLSSLRATGAPR